MITKKSTNWCCNFMHDVQQKFRKTRLLGLTFVVMSILVVAFFFRNPGMQSINWTFPYFSGAANLESLFEWRISPSDFESVSSMGVNEYLGYRHKATEDTVLNIVNNFGYVLIVYVARNIFPWMGDGNAVVTLQMLVHLLVVLATLFLLNSSTHRAVFFFTFGINPIVLHFVTFPFYYFWAVLPSFFLALVWFRGQKIKLWIFPIAVLLYLVFLTRPVTIIVCLLVFVVAYWKSRSIYPVVASLLFIILCFTLLTDSRSNFWDIAYNGIGAYENQQGIELSDNSAYDQYKRVTGKVISTHAIHGTFQNNDERRKYNDFFKVQYINSLKKQPMMHIRNAALNLIKSFGLGYDTKRAWVNIISGIFGLGIIFVVIWTKQWIWGVGILAYASTFTPYFPPIPAYLFGAYFFTALILAGLADSIKNQCALTRPERKIDSK